MRLLVFGFGYVGEALARHLQAKGWSVSATIRDQKDAGRLKALAVEPALLSDKNALAGAVGEAQAILVTAPPGPEGCPGLAALVPAIAQSGAFPDWIGYLSTTGVYGDREGGWVDEESVLTARSVEGGRRVGAERDWLEVGRGMGLTVTVFRLPGIYGPGRSPLDRVADPATRRVVKPGHVFSRIHVDDIASGLAASIERPRAGGIYNLVDDEPAPGDLVLEHAAAMLGVPPPPVAKSISAAQERFYAESKRVSNARAKAELGWRPLYPSYREGLAAIAAAG